MSDLYALHPHPVIPALASLRDEVLALNRARRPKWRFRLAPDLILQLQPWNELQQIVPQAQLVEIHKTMAWGDERRAALQAAALDVVLQFKGAAIVGREDVTSFDRKPDSTAPWAWLDFNLHAASSGWLFVLTHWRVRAGTFDTFKTTVDRVRSELRPERFAVFTPDLMLKPACLYCGKALTDPASMARWIGPECAGTGSLSVPRTYLLPALAAGS